MNLRKTRALILVLLMALSSIIVIHPIISSSSDVPDNTMPFDIDDNNITEDPRYQIDASIWGDKVVWEDYRNTEYGTPSTPGNGENSDIYMYNLTTGETFQITTNGSDQVNPDIWKDHLVWEDHRNGNGDIYHLNLSGVDLSEDDVSPEQVTKDNNDQTNPAIHSGKVVFEDFRDNYLGDIYMSDLEEDRLTSITDDNPPQIDPDIYGSRVVWADYRNHWPGRTKDVYMYDLGSAEVSEITNSGQNQHSPSIYKNKLTWVGYNGTNDNNIYLQDLGTGKRRTIIDSGLNEFNPKIYGERIAYHRKEYNEDEIPESDSIMIFNISEKEKILINESPSDPSYPAIAKLARPILFENHLVWEENHPSYDEKLDHQNDIFYGSMNNSKPDISSSTVSNGTMTSNLKIKMTLREGNELRFSVEITDKDGDVKDVYLNTTDLEIEKDRYRMKETKVGVYNLTLEYQQNMSVGTKGVDIIVTDKAGHRTSGGELILKFVESPPEIERVGVRTDDNTLSNETSFDLVEGNSLYFEAEVSDYDDDITGVFLDVSGLELEKDRYRMNDIGGDVYNFTLEYDKNMSPGVKNVHIVAEDSRDHSVRSETLTISAQEMEPPVIHSVGVGKDLGNLSTEIEFELKEENSIFFVAEVTDANDDLADVYLNLSEFNVEEKQVAMDPISGADNSYIYELKYTQKLDEGERKAHITATDEYGHQIESEDLSVDMVKPDDKADNGGGTGEDGNQVYYIVIVILLAIILGAYLLLAHTDVLKREQEEEKEMEEEESDI